MATNDKEQFLTEPELCALLGIHRNTARAWRESKTLPHFRRGRVIRYRESQILALFDGGTKEARRKS